MIGQPMNVKKLVSQSTKSGRVNFMPWKQHTRQKVKREVFVVLIFGLVGIVAILFANHLAFAKIRNPLQQRFAELQKELYEARQKTGIYQSYRITDDELTNRNRLLASITIMQKHMPKDMYITSIEVDENVQISGNTTNRESLQQLLAIFRNAHVDIRANLRQSIAREEGMDFVVVIDLPQHYCAYAPCSFTSAMPSFPALSD